MYHLSRAVYRDLACELPAHGPQHRDCSERLLHACESTVERLVSDPHYFARPAKALFTDVRFMFPISAQHRVWLAIDRHIGGFAELLRTDPDLVTQITGLVPPCQATTRRGAACQRERVNGSKYCPSHQHLSETESLDDAPQTTADRHLVALAA